MNMFGSHGVLFCDVLRGYQGGAYIECSFSGMFPVLTRLCHVPAGIIIASSSKRCLQCCFRVNPIAIPALLNRRRWSAGWISVPMSSPAFKLIRVTCDLPSLRGAEGAVLPGCFSMLITRTRAIVFQYVFRVHLCRSICSAPLRQYHYEGDREKVNLCRKALFHRRADIYLNVDYNDSAQKLQVKVDFISVRLSKRSFSPRNKGEVPHVPISSFGSSNRRFTPCATR